MSQESASKVLAAKLRHAILAGEYRPGEQLPSRRDLAREHGIAGNTAGEAVRRLAEEGLVHRHHGKGVFVTEPHTRLTPQQMRSRISELEDENADLRWRLWRAEGRLASHGIPGISE